MNWRGVLAVTAALSLWDGTVWGAATRVVAADGREIKMVDGDTLWVGRTPVRLADMDAPEMRQLCADPAGKTWACGVVAARVLRGLAVTGVRCELGRVDVYQRHVGRCYTTGGIDIGKEMVALGLAAAVGWPYRETETVARRGRVGVWAGRWAMPWNWRRSGRPANKVIP